MLLKAFIESIIQTITPHHSAYSRFAQQHQGKTCCITIGQQAFHLLVHQSGILFCDQPIDGYIHMEIEDMISFFSKERLSSSIQFSGDIALCQGLTQLIKLSAINCDGLLFDLLPDTLALTSLEGYRLLKSTLRHTQFECLQRLKDYLTLDSDLCASKKDCDALYEQTQQLKWLVDRLKS